jgi:DNA-binding transcriptional ArsR family regulator
MEDLREKVAIASLIEEEWGVMSFLDLLLRILQSIEREYPAEYNTKLFDRVESLYSESPDTAQQIAAELLKDFAGDRTLLLLVENLDDLFEGLGDSGQQQFRDYLEKYHFCTIFATSQHSFKGIDNKKAPFYNFLNLHYLEKLNLDEVVRLLKNIAKLEDNKELELFIETAKGRSRIEAIHHLAGGNHRVYMIFAEFLTRDSLDRLVKPFLQTLDELTPYYQARMAWLSPQQRKIVKFLCDRRGAVMVKEIAQRCFMTHQTASSQLKQLLGMGYVTSESIGRESYYQLQEVLMRFCMDVKKNRGEPISLIVDFLRLWYTQEELKQRLERLGLGFSAIGKELVDNRLEKSDLKYQLNLETVPPKNVVALELEYDNLFIWGLRGYILNRIKRYDEALTSLNRALELGYQSSSVFFNRALAILGLNRWDEGIAALDDAFQCIESNDDAEIEDAELIINNLFANKEVAIWKPRIASLIAVYEKHEYLSVLGQGIVRNIPALMSAMVSDKAARTWLELWQELTSNYKQFQIPIRLLNAAVRYKETKGDRRVLLELPIEERTLLEPLVSTKVE